MISPSRADAFMDKLITLVNSDFKTVKNMDVVLLLGGTGNGKSTVMNMIAGSKIFVAYDDDNGVWKFEAKPSIALIGHNNSMTFIPNYWQGTSLRVYDCPGFNDNRSIQHQIVKSFFIKEIADSARSIKVIVVGDIHCIHANRCGPFEDCFKQMKQLIPKFNPTTDCSLLVTKAARRDRPKHVFQRFKLIGVEVPMEKITLVNEPEDDGEYDYSHLKFESIISSTPTLRQNCNVPLSSDARLRLIQINQELNQSIEKAAAAYSSAVRRYYIEAITSDLSINNKTMKQLYSIVAVGEQNLKSSQNPQKFIDSIKDLSERLQQVGRIKFKYEEIYAFITRKNEQINYIKDKIDDFKLSMNYWINNIHFQCEPFQKSQNATSLKDSDTLRAYLRENLKIDLDSDIKGQAHAYLNKVNSFAAAYSGSKAISGYLTHNKTYSKDFEIPYVAEVQIGEYVPYNGSASYNGSTAVQVSVSVKRCDCSSTVTPNGCLFCNHNYFDVEQTKTVSYNGNVNYSGQQYYSNKERQIFTAKFSEAIKEDVSIKYNETVPFSGNHTANCKDHHFCSCQKLAQIVANARQLSQDISHYRKVANFQRKQLSRLKNANKGLINEDSSIIVILDQLSINGYKFAANSLSKNDIAAQIHDQLTSHHTFSEPFKGQTTFNISKQYSDVYLCEGIKNFTNKLTHSAYVPYSGSVYYSDTKSTSGSIKVWTCYQNCSWCKQSSYYKDYSKTFSVSGYAKYAGTTYFSNTYVDNHELKFSETVPFKGVVSKKQKVEYEGKNNVTCASSKTIGSGHHSCTSCETWERFVTGLKKLLEIQSGLLSEIQSNKREIKGLVQRQEMENKRLQQELAAKTMGQ